MGQSVIADHTLTTLGPALPRSPLGDWEGPGPHFGLDSWRLPLLLETRASHSRLLSSSCRGWLSASPTLTPFHQRTQKLLSLTHLGLHPYTLPVPALWEVGLRRVVPLPLPPRNPPLKLRPRRNLPDTPKVSVLSFRSSAHVVRLELKHRQVRETNGSRTCSPLSEPGPSLTRPGRKERRAGGAVLLEPAARQPTLQVLPATFPTRSVSHWTGLLGINSHAFINEDEHVTLDSKPQTFRQVFST